MTKPTKQNPEKLIRHHRFWRPAEMLPGLLTWSAFIFVILGSLYFPAITANIIIVYTLIWIYRTFYFAYHLSKSYKYARKLRHTDWQLLNHLIDNPNKLRSRLDRQDLQVSPLLFRSKGHNAAPLLLKSLQALQNNHQYLRTDQIYHCITLVTYKEPFEVIKSSVQSYIESDFDLSKVIFILAGEESDQANISAINDRIKQEFAHHFKHYLFTLHPKDLPGEHKGRAANATWAAKQLKKYLDQQQIPYQNVILSSFDADTSISKSYLSELTFRYAITPNRVEVGYQPVPFYHNNLWDVPLVNRMVAIQCSFWQWSVSLRKDENKSFSSRAMSFQSVIDFGYWDTKVVQDDSRQFWTAYFVYNGRHYLENLYSPIFMDAVQNDTYVSTIIAQYKQLRRWAWGASDFPFILFNMLDNRNIPWTKKIYEVFHFLESVFFWATGPILLIFAGSLPSLLNAGFRENILSYNLPKIMSTSLNIATVGILVCLLITVKVIPKANKRRFWKQLSIYLQWLLVPLVSVTLSSIPAIDAQTRLLINQRLDFNVTKKTRTE